MPWTWVRPTNPSVLDGRPLIDLGTGDGRTLAALNAGAGLTVGVDRSWDALRAARNNGLGRLVCADAAALPLSDEAAAVVAAGDLFHHLDDASLAVVLRGVHSALLPGGRLVAWWYERPGRPAPDAPAYPRAFEAVAAFVEQAGFGEAQPLPLEFGLEPAPPTVGLVACRL